VSRSLAYLHAVAAWVLVVMIALQVILAGLALRNLGGDGDFGLHAGFGYSIVGLAALALVVTAAVARAPRADIGLAVLVLVLYFDQTVLPAFRESMEILAALHPANAMLLFVLAIWAARRAGRLSTQATTATGSPAG
jgi:hypothetical protein